MSGLGITLVVVGVVAFWAAARAAKRKDAEHLGRRLPPNKRYLLEDRELSSYFKE